MERREKKLFWFIFSFGMFLLPLGMRADERLYVWTYEYKTMDKGKAEVEHYLTLFVPDIERVGGNVSSEHQIEVEVGMTEYFDFSIYQIFAQNAQDKALEYKGFKLRARYKIGKKGLYPLDLLLYLEYKGKPNFSKHGLEFKLISAKDIGNFNISFNPTLEWEREEEWKFEPKYTFGASYRIYKLLKIGFEAMGGVGGHYVGPVISHGKENLWVALGSAFRIGEVREGKSEFQIRMILGIGFHPDGDK